MPTIPSAAVVANVLVWVQKWLSKIDLQMLQSFG